MSTKVQTPPAGAIAELGTFVTPVATERVIQVTVSAQVWATRLALKAEIASREKSVEALDLAIGWPEAESIREPARIIVVDGNGAEIGKGSIFWFKGAVHKANWRRRIS